jgi:hypothetical protein
MFRIGIVKALDYPNDFICPVNFYSADIVLQKGDKPVFAARLPF